MSGNGEYELVEIEDDIVLWRRCVIDGCANFVCVGASEDYCYPHTVKWLYISQQQAMGFEFNRTPPNEEKLKRLECRYPLSFYEEALIDYGKREINHVGKEWGQCAAKILNIIDERKEAAEANNDK